MPSEFTVSLFFFSFPHVRCKFVLVHWDCAFRYNCGKKTGQLIKHFGKLNGRFLFVRRITLAKGNYEKFHLSPPCFRGLSYLG